MMSDHEFRDFYYRATFQNDDDDDHHQSVGESDKYGVLLSSSSVDHHPSYMSFTDCLHSTSMADEYGSLEKAFGFSPSSSEVFSSVEGGCNQTMTKQHVGHLARNLGGNNNNNKSEVMTNPNSSISSSSSEAGCEEDSNKSKKDKQLPKGSSEDGQGSSKKGNKAKKEGDKKQKEPRFAFMTKSEVDHLEDGYRWRKYGQKAVKNSAYPRSYYRCTTQKCTVKKRVERSFQDPSIVVTTYEGQHNHPLPTTLRGSAAAAAGLFPPPSLMLSSSPLAGPPSFFFPHELFMQMPHQAGSGSMVPENFNPFQQKYHHHQAPDCGLLQDMVPSRFPKHEP